jgi:hypothetical protein
MVCSGCKGSKANVENTRQGSAADSSNDVPQTQQSIRRAGSSSFKEKNHPRLFRRDWNWVDEKGGSACVHQYQNNYI